MDKKKYDPMDLHKTMAFGTGKGACAGSLQALLILNSMHRYWYVGTGVLLRVNTLKSARFIYQVFSSDCNATCHKSGGSVSKGSFDLGLFLLLASCFRFILICAFLMVMLQSLLEGNDLFGFLDGTNVCPPQFVFTEKDGVTTTLTPAFRDWKKTDRALISLIIATLSPEAMEYVVGCKSSHEAWDKLHMRYSTVSMSSVMQLKTSFQTLQKGSDTIERFLLRISKARDELLSLGVKVPEEDMVVVALNGLPVAYDMIMTVLKARETRITPQDLLNQLLGAERDIENRSLSLTSLTAMVANTSLAANSGSNFLINNAGASSSTQNSQSYNGNVGFADNGGHGQSSNGHDTNQINNGNANGYHGNGNGQTYNANRNSYSGNGNGNSRSNYNYNHNNGNGNGYNKIWNNNGGGRYTWNNNNGGGSNWVNFSNNDGDRDNNGTRNQGASPECQICKKRGFIFFTLSDGIFDFCNFSILLMDSTSSFLIKFEWKLSPGEEANVDTTTFTTH
ncbi:hypothetical protein RchiOBHm_Chr6g0299971 [Rosa chinensis]|uniref:RNA-directed DNA polymerase n=1 Tax=Rosa chinensis TaxID=74649 RepID=A0A2P6PYF4_ROSCH|nr:hypothetical protein RchiOBHm_Chr6g0299971 [Rosa chinensis]